jgi:agmatine deiminase
MLPALCRVLRRLLLPLLAALLTACTAPVAPEAAASYRIPGEFEPQQAVWLGYDPGHAPLTVALVQALQPHVKLKMLVADVGVVVQAREDLFARGLRAEDITFAVEPLAMYFMRDAAVFAVGSQGRLGVVDFKWNHYGLAGWCKRRHAGDARAEAQCAVGADTTRDALDRAIARLADASPLASTLFMEGAGIEVNGQGLLIANEALTRQRNPGRSRVELEQALLLLPGIKQVLWLPEGLAEDPHERATITGPYVAWGTGGHIDQFVRFADPQTVLLAWPDDADAATHPVARLNRLRMQKNLEILAQASGPDGAPLRVLKVPMPRIVERRVFLSAAADTAWSHQWTAASFMPAERRRQGDAVMQVASASYMNYVVANGVARRTRCRHGCRRCLKRRFRAGRSASSTAWPPTGWVAGRTAPRYQSRWCCAEALVLVVKSRC